MRNDGDTVIKQLGVFFTKKDEIELSNLLRLQFQNIFFIDTSRSDSKEIKFIDDLSFGFESFFIDDHLLKYPIFAGSISHFSESQEFLSVLYKTDVNLADVVEKIKNELELGAFNLISIFPTLESIYLEIINRHPYLYTFYNSYNERELLTVTCIVLLLYGKDKALEWTKENFREGSYKDHIIERLLVFEFNK